MSDHAGDILPSVVGSRYYWLLEQVVRLTQQSMNFAVGVCAALAGEVGDKLVVLVENVAG
jgi:hypothetical protein